jgi:hypothetical protein
MGPTHPMGIGGFFPKANRPGPEADHSPPTSAEVKEYVDLYIHTLIRLYGIVLNYLSTGTTLPFTLPLPSFFVYYLLSFIVYLYVRVFSIHIPSPLLFVHLVAYIVFPFFGLCLSFFCHCIRKLEFSDVSRNFQRWP